MQLLRELRKRRLVVCPPMSPSHPNLIGVIDQQNIDINSRGKKAVIEEEASHSTSFGERFIIAC